MATLRNKTELINKIGIDIPDNNAGAISAADIRDNLQDLTYSVNLIVSSGDHNTDFPFLNNVRASKLNGLGYGFFIAESGISFPNSSGAINQYEAYPGNSGLNHNFLNNRNVNSAHTQYLCIDGTRPMEENLPMGGNWINSSGASFDERGLKFTYQPSGDKITVGSGTYFSFNDGSRFSTARGTAKAWMLFDGSGTGTYGTPVVQAAYNIQSIEYLDPGKYKILIPSGIVKNANCIAIGQSNSRTTAASQEDFDRNSVGITQRSIDGQGRLSLTFLVLNDAGQYVDAQINELVVYAQDSLEGTLPTVTIIPKV
jgi:hypothetical protein